MHASMPSAKISRHAPSRMTERMNKLALVAASRHVWWHVVQVGVRIDE